MQSTESILSRHQPPIGKLKRGLMAHDTGPQAIAAGAPPEHDPATPMRLGLALSGGGFRATIFHLGVLIRLAELDLLRHLHVISSVSGGSILAAHYMLRLKVALEASITGTLSREEYIALVGRVRDEVRELIAQQPRCRLFEQPVDVFRMMFMGRTRWRLGISHKMSSLYQRFLLRRATGELRGAGPDDLTRGMPLCRMHVRLAALQQLGDIEGFNAGPSRDHVPKLVLNAATLNTGCKFTFTFSELGDEMLGHVRCDERWLLSGYKLLLAAYVPADDIGQAAERAAKSVERTRRTLPARDRPGDNDPDAFELRRFTAEHLAWWHAAHGERSARRELPGRSRGADELARRAQPGGGREHAATFRSAAVRHLLHAWEDSARFLEVLPGTLRVAKLAAWYVLDGAGWQIGSRASSQQRGGFTLAEHRERFWLAMRDIDAVMAARLRGTGDETDWMEFVVELYYFRVAENLYAGAPHTVTLPTAVQASANFPPVFSPIELRGLYDEARVRKLQLSDGGLNDNNGIESLMDERCTHIIASEAGPGPQLTPDVRFNRLGMMAQIVLNQLTIVRRLQLRSLREQARVHEAIASVPADLESLAAAPRLAALRPRYPVEAVAFFQIDAKLSDGVPETASPPPLAPHPLAPDIVRLRTDLDGFADIEQDALVYQGYSYCDRFVRRYLQPSLVARRVLRPHTPAPVAPVPLPASNAEWDRARRVLVAGKAPFLRAFRIGGVWRFAYLLALVLVLGAEVGAFVLVHALLTGAVRLPFLPHQLSLTWRWTIGWLSFVPDLSWATLVLFGQAMRLDGLFAALASRSAADERTLS